MKTFDQNVIEIATKRINELGIEKALKNFEEYSKITDENALFSFFAAAGDDETLNKECAEYIKSIM